MSLTSLFEALTELHCLEADGLRLASYVVVLWLLVLVKRLLKFHWFGIGGCVVDFLGGLKDLHLQYFIKFSFEFKNL